WYRSEEALAEKAKKEYDEGKYAAAARTYREVIKGFPDSLNLNSYKFWSEFADLRDRVGQMDNKPQETYDRLLEFLKANRDNKLLKPADVGSMFAKIASDFVDRAQETFDKATLNKADAALKDADKYSNGDKLVSDTRTRIKTVAEAIAKKEKVDAILAR